MPRRRAQFVVLAIDLGTSSVRSALFDEAARCLAGTLAARHYQVNYTADGGAELSPGELLRATRVSISETLRRRERTPALQRVALRAIGGCGFWHSLLGVDSRGHAITPVWTWADSRSRGDAARLRQQLDEATVHARTGCMLRAAFWPAKLLWLRRTRPKLVAQVKGWRSPADWVFNQLFGTNAISHSMASGTGFYDYNARSWDEQILRAVAVDKGKLPPLLDADLVARGNLRGKNLFPPIGDGAASNLGSGAGSCPAYAVNVGTSAAVRTIISREDRARLPLGLFRFVVNDECDVIGGATSNGGNLRRWMLRELKVAPEMKLRLATRRAAADSPLDVLPFWTSERAPTWPEDLHGTIVGLRQSTTAREIDIAATCASFYRLADILELSEQITGAANPLVLSGGITCSRWMLPLLADALGRELSVSTEPEASLRGAAVHILQKLGCKTSALRKGRIVTPDPKLVPLHSVRRTRQKGLEHLLLQMELNPVN
jgi:gluconokinase